MNELLNAENLIELHKKLNEFAEYHNDEGMKKAYYLVKEISVEYNANPKSAAKEDIAYDKGFELALNRILKVLNEGKL